MLLLVLLSGAYLRRADVSHNFYSLQAASFSNTFPRGNPAPSLELRLSPFQTLYFELHSAMETERVPETSNHLRQELQDIWMKTHKTIFFITHSVEEAVYLGDRVVVMSGEDGGIKNIVPIELDRPRHIYNEDFIAYRHKILEEIQGGDY